MKYLLNCLILLILCNHPIYAGSYIVMDGEDETIYSSSKIDYVQSIASVSKVMTAIVAIEKGELSDSWVVKDEISNSYGSSIYLKQNTIVNLLDLLYGLLLESGNDAADAIAYHVGGNHTATFIDWMNEKAKELHMKDTIYRNPSGLDEEDGGNLSTVYDQAILFKYCLKNPIFQQITQTKQYTTISNQQYINHNRLLWDFSYTIGGKTGYTLLAQHTLVTAARKDDITCIVVTFEMGEESNFHKQKYIEFYNDIGKYIIVSPQISRINGKVVTIKEPFIVHGTEEEFENGTLTIRMDDVHQQIMLIWKTDIRTSVMYYPYV